jgi:hypothetical protein
MAGRVIIDAAGVLDDTRAAGAGLDVYGVGSGTPITFHPVIWRPLEWIATDPPSTSTTAPRPTDREQDRAADEPARELDAASPTRYPDELAGLP